MKSVGTSSLGTIWASLGSIHCDLLIYIQDLCPCLSQWWHLSENESQQSHCLPSSLRTTSLLTLPSLPILPMTLVPVFVPSQSGIPFSSPATCSLVHSVPEAFMPVAEVFMVATRLDGKGGGFGNRTGTDLKGRVWGAGICYTEIEGARQRIHIYI